MRHMTFRLELVILTLMATVVIVFMSFGLLFQTKAAPITPSRVQHDRTVQVRGPSIDEMVLGQFSQLVGTTVARRAVQGWTVEQKPFSRAVLECPGAQYRPVQGYKVTFKYQGVQFDYRVDAALLTVILCHIKVIIHE